MHRFLLFCIGLILLAACSPEKPKAIWNPTVDLNGTPTISQVLPSGEQFFADMEIHIKGTNFSANADDNAVYFDSEKAAVISSSVDELVVRRPKLAGDSITIKVVVRDAYTFATFSPYKIEKVKEE
ncbi:MAG: hypothetical protein EHM72_20475, partial [Calditrichaeota bacterium]